MHPLDPRKETLHTTTCIIVDGEPIEEIDYPLNRKDLIKWAEDNNYLQYTFTYMLGKLYAYCKQLKRTHIIESCEYEFYK